MNFSVTQYAKPLDPSQYSWDEKSKTFATNESYLVLDFSGINDVTFRTGSDCVFKTGSYCAFKTGSYCAFKTGCNCTFLVESYCSFITGFYCTFTTGSDCVFKTGDRCTFNSRYNCTFVTGNGCSFNTGGDCTFNVSNNCTFNTTDRCTFTAGRHCTFKTRNNCSLTYNWKNHFEVYKLEPNKLVLLMRDGKLKSLLGQIQTSKGSIVWWKNELNEIIIKVGCQTHSLDTWKERYEEIAEENEFFEFLIPEYLKHLETIEKSFK